MSNITTIHAERQCESTGRWYQVELPEVACDYCDLIAGDEPCPFCKGSGSRRPDLYTTSNHHVLSAVLADVRNGDGSFYGAGGHYPPISKPRGLPKDLSDSLRDQFREFDPYYTVASWLTLDEVLTHESWNTETTVEGWLSPEEYRRFKKMGKPERYCHSVSGAGVRKVTNAQMDTLLAASESTVAVCDESTYTFCRWQETAREQCADFFEALDEHVAPLAQVHRYERWHALHDEALLRGKDAEEAVRAAEEALNWRDDPSKTRLVFWFDQP